MFTKIVFRLVTNVAGDGDTGKAANCDFLKSPYSYPADVIPGVSVAEIGTTGCYVASGFTTFQLAKLFVSGVERTSFSEQPTGDLIAYLVANYGRLGSANTWAAAQAINGLVTMGAAINANSNDIYNLPASPGTATSAIRLDYADARYMQPGGEVPANIIEVHHAFTDVSGKRYNTIQEAIDYAAGTGAASSSNRFSNMIYPSKNNTNYGSSYAESLTLKKFCDLIGKGRTHINCALAYSGTWTGGTYAKWENISNYLLDTNMELKGIEYKDCDFIIEEDVGAPQILPKNSQFVNCGFWQKGNLSNDLISSTNDNTFINCRSNADVTSMISGGDVIIGNFDMYVDHFKYLIIT